MIEDRFLNSLGREEKSSEEKKGIFTKETFGVVIMLFSALSLVLVITRGAVFGEPGVWVNSFFFGCFGYFSFLICAFLFYLGFSMLTEKKLPVSKKITILVALFLVILAVLTQTISLKATGTYGEYIKASYLMGGGGIKTSSCGGAFAGFISFWTQKLLSAVGSYVVLGAMLALDVYFIVRIVINERGERTSPEKFRSSYQKPQPAAATAANGENEETPAATESAARQRLFIAGEETFGFKGKKDAAKADSLTMGFEKGGLGVASYGSYKQSYESDLQEKINYVKTPKIIEIGDINGSGTNGAPVVSDYIAPESPARVAEDVTPHVTERAEQNVTSAEEIPFIEHGEEESERTVRPTTSFEKYANVEEVDSVEMPSSPEEQFTEYSEREETEEEISEAFSIKEEEELPPSNVGGRRARNILFGDDEKKPEKDDLPAFTSRAESDGNNDFPTSAVSETEKEVISEEKEEGKVSLLPEGYEYDRPPLDLLETYSPPVDAAPEDHKGRMEIIEKTFADFHINAVAESYVQGPSITRYEIRMPAGVSVKKILGYDEDFRMWLSSKYGVRIEAPIPGKSLVGIEVANAHPVTVGLKSIMEESAGQRSKPGALMFAIGKDIVGKPIIDNLSKGPHYLVAGATGSGKSVCLNVMIVSLIMRYGPEELRLILIDPKGNEFRPYEHIPHLLVDEIITEPKKALAVLSWAHDEMERRYRMLEEAGGIRDIDSYNESVEGTQNKMPRIVIVVDELSNLMETCKKEMEARILSIAQKARAIGIHLVLATQRPSVDVITGVIKANLPSRIALKVTNFADSNTILAEGGAEKLLGHGDMLYKNSGMPESERYQGAWISDREINNVVGYIREHNENYYDEKFGTYLENATKPKEDPETLENGSSEEGGEINEFFLKALWLAVNTGTVSISLLQRRYSIGYARAGGLVDKMERMGFVSANEGSKARRVLLTREEFESRFGTMSDDF